MAKKPTIGARSATPSRKTGSKNRALKRGPVLFVDDYALMERGAVALILQRATDEELTAEIERRQPHTFRRVIMAQSQPSEAQTDWTSPPIACPYCAGTAKIRTLDGWVAQSNLEPVNTATLTEYQCHSACCNGRSFWTSP